MRVVGDVVSALLSLPLSLVYPSMSPSTATLQARSCVGRWAGQSPLTNLALAESTGCKLVVSTGIDPP